MKHLLYALMLMVLAGCQKEELTIIEGQDEEAFTQDRVLKNLIMSVASHDGSFDDIVDKSSCFSIDFPYVCFYNGYPYTVNSIEDLAPFQEGDKLIPEFPVNITFADYIQAEVPNEDAFNDLIAQCENGLLFNQSITCVDIVYPIRISIYNPDNSEFETISFTHDKQTFQSIEDFDASLIASIQFPIQIEMPNNVVLTINSNDVLKSEILDMIPFCE
ncbi:MAG: hypothetical protein HKO61_06765 [Flavobacteriaceae bacterium]|nr:hypothetical protein [Flavobacteriaceae bacterium]NNK55567.1 hypothetical protein [Flavobacteriaceae bacterium]NNM08857.1 hypothetical protein [Flavobacteriaceae bacterium]